MKNDIKWIRRLGLLLLACIVIMDAVLLFWTIGSQLHSSPEERAYLELALRTRLPSASTQIECGKNDLRLALNYARRYNIMVVIIDNVIFFQTTVCIVFWVLLFRVSPNAK